MSNTYNIGTTPTSIELSADINTIGLAASRASVIELAGTASGIAVAHSADATGDILPAKSIGDNALLKGKRLSVFTKISLLGDDKEARKKEAASITATYTLNGGESGLQTYNNPKKTINDPNVFLNFIVDLQ